MIESAMQDFLTHDFANQNFKKFVYEDFLNKCN